MLFPGQFSGDWNAAYGQEVSMGTWHLKEAPWNCWKQQGRSRNLA